MTRALSQILRGGYCTRWHAHPDLAHIRETLAEHHGRVAQIILALHPSPSITLIDAALHHDAGEPIVGDLPYPFKLAYPEFAAAHADIEDRERERLGCHHYLTDKEQAWLKFADRLAGWMHVSMVAPHLLAASDWQLEKARLVAAADTLGICNFTERLGISFGSMS